MPYLIRLGFVGEMGSGKTTRANYLIEQYGFKKYAFGDKLKQYCMELFGRTDREVLQVFGSFCRMIKRDCWIDLLGKSLDYTSNLVVDDIRFYNEAKFLHSNGFTLVRLCCPFNIRLERVKALSKYTMGCEFHESELSVDEIPAEMISYYIDTSGELEFSSLDDIIFDIQVKMGIKL